MSTIRAAPRARPMLRVASLLIRQLCDEEVDDQWPSGSDPERTADTVRDVLARDAARIHGGDRPPPDSADRESGEERTDRP